MRRDVGASLPAVGTGLGTGGDDASAAASPYFEGARIGCRCRIAADKSLIALPLPMAPTSTLK